jgi:CBS domain containing-hemolysin-like protein
VNWETTREFRILDVITKSLLLILVLVLLVHLEGVFVAAEIAIVRVRCMRLE